MLLPVKFKIYKFRFAFSKHFTILPWGFMVWKIIKFTTGVEIGNTHTVQYSVHSLRCISFCAKLHTYYLWSSDPIFILQETNSKNSIKPLACNHAIVMKENRYAKLPTTCSYLSEGAHILMFVYLGFYKIFFQIICDFVQVIIGQINLIFCQLTHNMITDCSLNYIFVQFNAENQNIPM